MLLTHWSGQADDQPFEDQPRRHRALALQIEVGLQQPAVELRPAMPAQQAELPLGLLQHERADARLLQDARGDWGGAGPPRPASTSRVAAAKRRSEAEICPKIPIGCSPEASSRSSCSMASRVLPSKAASSISQVVLVRQPPTDRLDHLGRDLPILAGQEGQLGQFLVQEPQFRPDQLDQRLGGRRQQFGAVMLLGPTAKPLAQPRRRGGVAVDQQPLGGDRFVEPRVARQRVEIEHQHAAAARPGDVVFQLRAITGDEIVGVFHHGQPLPAAEHGHGRKDLVYVAEERAAALEGGQREVAVVAAEHGRPQTEDGLPPQERLAAEHGRDRPRRVFARIGEIVECRNGFFGHAFQYMRNRGSRLHSPTPPQWRFWSPLRRLGIISRMSAI